MYQLYCMSTPKVCQSNRDGLTYKRTCHLAPVVKSL